MPNRWTSPSAAIASAHHWLACSIASAWVVGQALQQPGGAVIQGRAGEVGRRITAGPPAARSGSTGSQCPLRIER